MIAKPLHLLLAVVVVSIAATAATVTPITVATVSSITADVVVVAAQIPLPQVVDDPERNLRAGSGIDVGRARKVEDEAARAQVKRRCEAHSRGKLPPGHLSFYAPGGVRPRPWRLRSRLRRRLGSRWQCLLARPDCLAG
jgi:hypothetical protein